MQHSLTVCCIVLCMCSLTARHAALPDDISCFAQAMQSCPSHSPTRPGLCYPSLLGKSVSAAGCSTGASQQHTSCQHHCTVCDLLRSCHPLVVEQNKGVAPLLPLAVSVLVPVLLTRRPRQACVKVLYNSSGLRSDCTQMWHRSITHAALYSDGCDGRTQARACRHRTCEPLSPPLRLFPASGLHRGCVQFRFQCGGPQTSMLRAHFTCDAAATDAMVQ